MERRESINRVLLRESTIQIQLRQIPETDRNRISK